MMITYSGDSRDAVEIFNSNRENLSPQIPIDWILLKRVAQKKKPSFVTSFTMAWQPVYLEVRSLLRSWPPRWENHSGILRMAILSRGRFGQTRFFKVQQSRVFDFEIVGDRLPFLVEFDVDDTVTTRILEPFLFWRRQSENKVSHIWAKVLLVVLMQVPEYACSCRISYCCWKVLAVMKLLAWWKIRAGLKCNCLICFYLRLRLDMERRSLIHAPETDMIGTDVGACSILGVMKISRQSIFMNQRKLGPKHFMSALELSSADFVVFPGEMQDYRTQILRLGSVTL